MNWRGFKFFKVQGEVVRTDIWSETHVTGDKNHVSSRAVAKQCYWISYGDGLEIDIILPIDNFNAKVGHKVTIVAMEEGDKNVNCLLLNTSTGRSCPLNNAHSLTWNTRKIGLLWLGLLGGAIITFVGSISNSGPTVVLGLCLLGLAIWSKLSISSDDKDFQKAVEEYARVA